MTLSQTRAQLFKEEWKDELREFFDKNLKAKKPTMMNLERELLVNFMIIKCAETARLVKEEALKIVKEVKKGYRGDQYRYGKEACEDIDSSLTEQL